METDKGTRRVHEEVDLKSVANKRNEKNPTQRMYSRMLCRDWYHRCIRVDLSGLE